MSMINGVSDFYGTFNFDGLPKGTIKSMSFLYDQYRDSISEESLSQTQRFELIAWCVHNFQIMLSIINSWDQENFFEMRITQMNERYYSDFGYYVYEDIRSDRVPFNEYLISNILERLYIHPDSLEKASYIIEHPENFKQVPSIDIGFRMVLIIIFIIISFLLFRYV